MNSHLCCANSPRFTYLFIDPCLEYILLRPIPFTWHFWASLKILCTHSQTTLSLYLFCLKSALATCTLLFHLNVLLPSALVTVFDLSCWFAEHHQCLYWCQHSLSCLNNNNDIQTVPLAQGHPRKFPFLLPTLHIQRQRDFKTSKPRILTLKTRETTGTKTLVSHPKFRKEAIILKYMPWAEQNWKKNWHKPFSNSSSQYHLGNKGGPPNKGGGKAGKQTEQVQDSSTKPKNSCQK